MDAKSLLESLDFSKENIRRQALIYSFSNILTLSMLSGFGIKCDMTSRALEGYIEELNKEFNINTDESEESNELQDLLCAIDPSLEPEKENYLSLDKNLKFIKNLNPIKAIYSKASLVPSSDNGFEKNTNFALDLANNKLEKQLNPKNQGLLILNELNLSKLLYDKSLVKRNQNTTFEEKLIAMILLELAINQAIFCHEHLRNNQGLFVEKVNLSCNLNEIDLDDNKAEIDWEDQVYMISAYALLYETLSDSKYEKYFDHNKADIFKGYAFDLLSILENHEYEILELETASLSSSTSSIIEALNILDDDRKHLSFTLSLCDELYAREKRDGFMLSHRHTKETASLASHFKSIEALTRGFEFTNFNMFLNASEEIYKNLNSTWDDNLGLFNLDGSDSIRYSSKSISYVLKSLNELSKTTSSSNLKENIKNQLTDFFDSSINGAGLQSPPPSLRMDMNMFRSSEPVSSVIEDIIEDKKVYIIEKGFEINKSDNQINKYSNEFSSEHVLFASDAMLSLALEDSSKS
ncbi:hypothetical protein R9X47_21560 [Wukongibacter baidiensis]|uniref:hypothetical protein n=1 Tax=Wukongibacter baidiensis TaxID=1723361 RepID=UPI003D7F5E5E